jgi:hypothetical protein
MDACAHADDVVAHQTLVNPKRALDSVGDAWELNDPTVAQALDDGAFVFAHNRLEKLLPQLAQDLKRTVLVLAHHAGIVDYIGGQYGGKAAFHRISLPQSKYYPIGKGMLVRANGGFWHFASI